MPISQPAIRYSFIIGLSGLFSLLMVYLIHSYFIKYKFEQLAVYAKGVSSLHDYNNDGKPEVVRQYLHNDINPSIDIKNLDMSHIDQITFHGESFRLDSRQVCFFDLDSNGVKELIYPFIKNDTLYFGIQEAKQEARRQILSTTVKIDKSFINDYSIGIEGFYDLDNNGLVEILYSLNAGYALQPRKVYRTEIHTKKTWKTPWSGFIPSNIKVYKSNNGENILLPQRIALSHNYPDTLYDDRHPWFVQYNDTLGFYTDPLITSKIETRGMSNFLLTNRVTSKIFSTHSTIRKDFKALVHILDLDGIVQDSLVLSTSTRTSSFFQYSDSAILLLDRKSKSLSKIDIDANLSSFGELPVTEQNPQFHIIQIDSDIEKEFIVKSKYKLYMIDNDFSIIAEREFFKSSTLNSNGFWTNGENTYITIETDDYMYVFSLDRNPLFPYKYPSYIAIFLLFLGLTSGISNNYQLIQSNRRRKILELQLKAFKDQFNTHFTFNILNSIASVIYEEDKEKAHQLFTKFSNLIRFSLESSDSTAVSLKQELDAVETFLELQKFRFKERFEYQITKETEVDKHQLIPKQLIQSYLENTFKHAFNEKLQVNRVEIKICQKWNQTLIFIRDNGKGFDGKTKKSGGLKMMDEYFHLFKKLHQIHITQSISTIKQEDEIIGTEIKITITP